MICSKPGQRARFTVARCVFYALRTEFCTATGKKLTPRVASSVFYRRIGCPFAHWPSSLNHATGAAAAISPAKRRRKKYPFPNCPFLALPPPPSPLPALLFLLAARWRAGDGDQFSRKNMSVPCCRLYLVTVYGTGKRNDSREGSLVAEKKCGRIRKKVKTNLGTRKRLKQDTIINFTQLIKLQPSQFGRTTLKSIF